MFFTFVVKFVPNYNLLADSKMKVVSFGLYKLKIPLRIFVEKFAIPFGQTGRTCRIALHKSNKILNRCKIISIGCFFIKFYILITLKTG
mgnify:CR=1 FL=1